MDYGERRCTVKSMKNHRSPCYSLRLSSRMPLENSLVLSSLHVTVHRDSFVEMTPIRNGRIICLTLLNRVTVYEPESCRRARKSPCGAPDVPNKCCTCVSCTLMLRWIPRALPLAGFCRDSSELPSNQTTSTYACCKTKLNAMSAPVYTYIISKSVNVANMKLPSLSLTKSTVQQDPRPSLRSVNRHRFCCSPYSTRGAGERAQPVRYMGDTQT